jgi:stearoyl-CoA desaturase (Delta-9 desaturase)
MSRRVLAFLGRLGRWVVNDAPPRESMSEAERGAIDWIRFTPFALLHIAALGVFFTGVSAVAIGVALALYLARMFCITAFYHRYFSHRAFKVGRVTQFVMAVAGCTAGQRGPLWWASHHREHHLSSDTPNDPHSPKWKGFLHSHTVWFLTRGSFATQEPRVRDWLKFSELRWLERFEWVPFVALGAACYGLGALLAAGAPQLGTNGPQMLILGFVCSTVALYHATYSTNSIAHKFGRRRFNTNDDSRNNAWVALLTLGEGWHNNHHFYPVAAKHGFAWWEIDMTWMGIAAMRALGLACEAKTVPTHMLEDAGFGANSSAPDALSEPLTAQLHGPMPAQLTQPTGMRQKRA